MFVDLGNEVTSSQPKSALAHKLRGMIPTFECEGESEDNSMLVDAGPSTGEKRKMLVLSCSL